MAATTTTAETAQKPRGARRKLIGIVTSDKMDKTRVVTVTRRVSHKAYAKYVTQRVRYKAHDERNEFKAGDTVEIIESKPISRDKRWRVERLVKRAEEV
jgi:small subunit ribosomal protein S17